MILFGRHKVETKLKAVREMGRDELLGLDNNVFQRILKETGSGFKEERTRRLTFTRAIGNDWNSEISEIYRTSSSKIGLIVYHQLSSTDTTLCVSLSEFLSPGKWVGESYERDRYGMEKVKYCIYTPDQKAEVIREILITYLKKKYQIE